MDYNMWPSKVEKIGSLFLDPKNPRLPKKTTPYSQTEIITELIKRNDVFDIAKNIAEDGYSPLEAILVYEDKTDGKKYVLEGNRRLTACKALLNPNLAPEDSFKKFNEIAKKFDTSILKSIRIVVAPDRESAYKIIVRKHTKSAVKDWEPIMKSNFYAQRIEEGMSIEHASKIMGISETEIRDAVSLLQIYDSATKLNLDSSIRDIVCDPYKFEISTFERLVTRPVTRNFLGISVNNKNGDVLLKIDKNEYDKGLTKIVSDLATKRENSRSLNNTKDIEDYLENRITSTQKPDLKKKIEPIKLNNSTSIVIAQTTIKQSVKSAVSKTPVGLIPNKFPCLTKDDKTRDVYNELRKLSPDKFPNSCAMSLRMFLELSTYEFLNKNGELDDWRNELKSKGTPAAKLKDWVPELKPMLNRVIQKKLIDDPQVLRSLSQFVNDDSIKPIIASLNQFVHNSKWHPNETRLRHFWKDLSSYLEIINS